MSSTQRDLNLVYRSPKYCISHNNKTKFSLNKNENNKGTILYHVTRVTKSIIDIRIDHFKS